MVKGNVVSVHRGMKTYEEWWYKSTILEFGTRWSELSASCPGRFTPGTHCIGGCVGPRGGLEQKPTKIGKKKKMVSQHSPINSMH
jgi:hypothetical protein